MPLGALVRPRTVMGMPRADPALEIPSCALDRAGVGAQQARYRRLAADVSEIERTEATVVVRFAASVDRRLLGEALDIERACCPFFTFEVEDGGQRVTIGVNQPDQVPALAALASALSPGR